MIGFVGLSHLGINYSLATAEKGFDVLAYEPDKKLCEQMQQGKFPIKEPGLVELFEKNKSRVHYTSDISKLSECELVFFSLDVKTDEKNQSDLAPLRQLIESVAPHLASGATMVVLSQVTPGFTRQLATDLRKQKNFKAAYIYYQVETLIFGRAVERALQPERYMIGCEDPAELFPPLYQKWQKSFDCPVLPMRYESAELAKIAINFFLVSSVSTTNTLAEICENIGAEWSEIVPALRLDARIGPKAYLAPGLGIAGGNLERDLITVKKLAEKHRTDVTVVDSWTHNSRHRRDWTRRMLKKELLSKKKKPLCAVWGLAYKQNTHSTKNSPSLAFLESVPDISVQACDPQVKLAKGQLPHVNQVESELAACQGAEALLVLTPWPQFAEVDIRKVKKAMCGNLILDPHTVLDPIACKKLGFKYFRLGSPLK